MAGKMIQQLRATQARDNLCEHTDQMNLLLLQKLLETSVENRSQLQQPKIAREKWAEHIVLWGKESEV